MPTPANTSVEQMEALCEERAHTIESMERQVDLVQSTAVLCGVDATPGDGMARLGLAPGIVGGYVTNDAGEREFCGGDASTRWFTYDVSQQTLDMLETERESAARQVESLAGSLNESALRYDPEERRTVHERYVEAFGRQRAAEARFAVISALKDQSDYYTAALKEQRDRYEKMLYDYRAAEPDRIARAVAVELLDREPRVIRSAALGESCRCIFIQRESQAHASGCCRTPTSHARLKQLSTTERLPFEPQAVTQILSQIETAERDYTAIRGEIEALRDAAADGMGNDNNTTVASSTGGTGEGDAHAQDRGVLAQKTRVLKEREQKLAELRENAAVLRLALDVADCQAEGMDLDARTTTAKDLQVCREDVRHLRRMLRTKYSTGGVLRGNQSPVTSTAKRGGGGHPQSTPGPYTDGIDATTPTTRAAADTRPAAADADDASAATPARERRGEPADVFWSDPDSLTVEEVLNRLKETEAIVDLCISHNRLAAAHYVRERTKWTVDVRERERMVTRYERDIAEMRQRERALSPLLTPGSAPSSKRGTPNVGPALPPSQYHQQQRPGSAPAGAGGRAVNAARDGRGVRGRDASTPPPAAARQRPATASASRTNSLATRPSPCNKQKALLFDEHYMPLPSMKLESVEQEEELLGRLYDRPLKRILNPLEPPPIADDPERRSPKHGKLTIEDMADVNNSLYYGAVERQRKEGERVQRKYAVGKKGRVMDKDATQRVIDKLYTNDMATKPERKKVLFQRHVLSKEKQTKKFKSQDQQSEFFEKMYAAKKA